MSECTGRGGYDLGLVWRHTFPSSSRRPCNPCLGGFSKLKIFFTYLVSPKSCAQSVLSGTCLAGHISCFQLQCAGFLGPRSLSCRDMMRCSVKVMIKAWRTSRIGGQKPGCVKMAYYGWDTSSKRCISRKSYQRISVIVLSLIHI